MKTLLHSKTNWQQSENSKKLTYGIENVFPDHRSDKGLVYKIYGEFI